MLPLRIWSLDGQSQDPTSQSQLNWDSFDPNGGVYDGFGLGTTDAVGGESGETGQGADLVGVSTQTITTSGSGLVFVNTYTANVSAQYQNAIIAAEQFLETNITNSVTINVTFSTQNAGTSGFVGENSWFYQTVSYATLKSALASHATSANDQAAVAALPATDPSNGAGFAVTNALAKALGLMNANGSETDDTVYLNSADSYFYSQSSPVAGEFDATSTLEHELTEAMGRDGGLGLAPNNIWAIMDLFRYSAPGQRDYTGGADGKPTYFSVNGTTLLTQFNNPVQVPGDAADWNPSTQFQEPTLVSGGFDSFGAAPTGEIGIVTPTDLTVMDVIGWTLANNSIPPPPTPNPGPILPINDFTGNNISDILFQNTVNGQVYEWITNGTTITGSGFVGNNSNTSWQVITGGGDYNGDGKSDILWENVNNGQVYEYQMNGTSVIASSFIGNNTDPSWQVVSSGDFYGNGESDILFQNVNSGQVYEWEMNGFSVIGSGFVGNNTSPSWQVVGTGDFTGTGISDVLFQNVNNGQVYEWQMNGTTVVASGLVGNNTDPSWHVVGIGDFTGNGKSDILFQNINSGQIYEWQMNGFQVTASGFVGNNTDPTWQVVGTGDFTGNGIDGILLQNTVSGQLYEWQMNGFQVTGGGFVGNNTSPTWHAIAKT